MPGKRPNGTKTSSGKSKSDENTKKISDAEKQYDLDEELRKTKNGSIGKFSSLLDKHSRAQFANAAKNLMDGLISDVNGNGNNHHNNNIEKNLSSTTSSTIGSRLDGEAVGGGCNKRKRSSSIESSCSDESSELVVLSMVLNKKQKESDDVAMAIERLRENGVTCVYFSMDDIRKGTLKPGIPVSSKSKHRHSQKQQENNNLESKDKDKSSVHNNVITTVANTNGYSTFNGHHIKTKHQLLEVPVTPSVTLNHSTSPLRPFSPQPPPLSPQQHESMPILLVNNHHEQHQQQQPELKANFLKEIGLETKLLTENNSSLLLSTNETGSKIVNEPTTTTKKSTKRKRRRKFVFSNNKKKRKTTLVDQPQPPIVLPTNVNVDKDLVIKKLTIDDINGISADFKPAKLSKRTDRDNSDFWEVPPLSPSILKSLDDTSLESDPQNNDHQKTSSKVDSDLVKEKKIDLEAKPTPKPTSTDTLKVAEALLPRPSVIKPVVKRRKKKASTIKRKKKVDNNTSTSSSTRAFITSSGGSDIVVVKDKKKKFIKVKTDNLMPSLSTTLDVDDDKDTYSFKKEFSPDIISYKKVRQIQLEEKLANNNNINKANTSSSSDTTTNTTTTTIPSKKKNNKKKCVQSISLDLDSKLKNVQKIIEITATTSSTQIHPHNNSNKDKEISTFDFDELSTKGKIDDLSLPIAIPLEKVKAEGPLRKKSKIVKRKGLKVKRKILKVKHHNQKRNQSKSPIIVQEKVKESENEKVKVSAQKPTAKTAEPFLVPITIPPSINDTSPTSTGIYPRLDDSLPEANTDSMQLRRSSFYSLVSGNVRTNMENYLDGRPLNFKLPKRRKRPKNGFLLHHGDNCPEDPESPYRLHLATQILLKLNKRRAKVKPKEQNHKSFYSYFKLVAVKRSTRAGKNEACTSTSTTTLPGEDEEVKVEEPLFSGEWTQPKKFICHLCGQVENTFWDMVTHKGEEHPGVVVTHMDLTTVPSHGLIRPPPKNKYDLSSTSKIPPCSKCSTTFDKLDELHRHIFECADNLAWLEEKPVQQVINNGGKKKKGGKRRRGGCYTFKRRLSNTPKKNITSSASVSSSLSSSSSPVKKLEQIALKRRPSIEAAATAEVEMYKCEFCTRIFKTEFWLKNHKTSHSLPISIPLDKLSLPKLSRASNNSASSSSLTAAILSLRSRDSLKN